MKQFYFTGAAIALWAAFCPILSVHFFLSRVESALFQEQDCFECLSPHKKIFGDAKYTSPTCIAA